MPPAQAVPLEKSTQTGRTGINAILLGAPGSGKGTQVIQSKHEALTNAPKFSKKIA